MGLMVFQSSSNSTFIVLDGQQRLATAVVFYSSLRRWLKQYDEYVDDSGDIQRDYIGRRELGQTEFSAKLTLNAANNDAFTKYIISAPPIVEIQSALHRAKKRDRDRRLLEAAIYVANFVDRIAAEFGVSKIAAEYFFKIVNYMRDNVGVVRLVVPNDNIAYTIFETLNDRGLELSPLDLLKNYLFNHASQHSSIRLKSLEDRWAQMMQTLSPVRSDNFLKVFWTSRHGRIRTRDLFKTLKETYSTQEQAYDLSIDLLDSSEKYAALESPDDPTWAPYSSETRRRIRTLKILGSQQAYPVILSALSKFEPKEFDRLIKLIEVCIVRYLLVVGGNTGNFESTCAILARKIYNGEITKASAAFHEMRNLYPSDNEFVSAFSNKDEESNPKAQYFLRSIELEMRRREGGELHDELQPGTLTVEHICPQNLTEEWNKTGLTKDNVYRLGNMCLLNDVNRALGRKSFAEKRETFKKSNLISTRHVAEFDEWNFNSIEERQKEMAKTASAVWAFQ